jgi:RNA polymerase sigma factor (sigma-70 family)
MARNAANIVWSHLRRLAGKPEAPPVADVALLERFVQDGDEAAFEELLHRHGALVLRVARRVLGPRPDVDDVFQATFLTLARRAGAIRNAYSLTSWLHGVALRLALKVRAQTLRREMRPVPPAAPVTPADPLDVISGRELCAVVDQELQRLPERYRSPLLLCMLEDHTHEEAARLLGCPLGTLRSRLIRGRELLRVRLGRRGLVIPVGLGSLVGLLPADAAAVPAALTALTIRGAVHFALGQPPAQVSVQAVALAEGMVRAMNLTKWKMACAVLLAAAIAGAAAAPLLREREPQVAAEVPAAAKTPPPALDLYGDPLPQHALARMGTVRLRSTQIVAASIALSPDGKLIASYRSTRMGGVCLWDAVTGQKIREIDVPHVRRVVFSPDSRKLAASGGARVIKLWDVATGQAAGELPEPHLHGSDFLAFAQGGKALLAVGSSNRAAVLFDVASSKELARLEKLPEGMSHLAVSADAGLLVFWARDQALHAWDVRAGKELWQRPNKGYPAALDFSPTAKNLLLATNDVQMGGKLAQVTYLGSHIHILDATIGKEISHWDGPKAGLGAAVIGAESKTVLVGSYDRTVHVLDTATGKELRQFPANLANTCCLSQDGRILATPGTDHRIRVWEVATGKELGVSGGHDDPVVGLAFSRDGAYLVTGSADRSVRLWNSRTGKEVGPLAGTVPQSYAPVFAPDGKTVAGPSFDNGLRLWDLTSREEIARFQMGPWAYAAFTPDSRTLVAADTESVILWDIAEKKEMRRFAKTKKWFHALSRDGALLAAAGEDKQVHLWDTSTGKDVRQLPLEGGATHLAFSPDGKMLAVAQHMAATVRLWDVATGREVRTIGHKSGLTTGMAFAPDGKALAWGDAEGVVHLYEVATGRERMRWQAHPGWLKAIAYAPDSQRLASGSDDTTAVVWDVTGQSAAVGRPEPKGDELDALWENLGSSDAAKALLAMGRLQASGTAVSLFRDRLRPTAAVEESRLAALLADLASDHRDVRARATTELEKLEDSAEAALRKVLETKPTLELRQRVERLLNLLEQPGKERVRMLRAIELLEHIGTAEAKALLEVLAKGLPGGRRTREAQAALDRLRQ